ncbi:cell wall hydrolase [Billgrantia azerbaijanica]|nr:cell wall hydrolase [Halomonas azerbaijanica]
MQQVWVVTGLVVLLFFSRSLAAEEAPLAEEATDKAEALEEAVAPESIPAPPPEPPPEPLTEPEVQAVDPTGDNPLEEPITCLSRSIYWEAKGQPGIDMEAVANVVMNRLAHPGFPDTICAVVTQGSEQSPCQFSWWCDGRPDDVVNEEAYEVAKEVARQALNQQLDDHTNGALYFHSRDVMPDWAAEYLLTIETDHFLFYRPEGDASH